MSLVTTKELLLDAQKNGYAVGAFNVENMEMVQAVVAAAEELKSPVIMQTTPSTIKYASPEMFYANVAAAAKDASVPVVMHLDHGSSFELAVHAFRAGYTSIMIDGSHSVFEENIAITKSVVDVCHAGNVPVEAELGKVGGKEDDLDGGNGLMVASVLVKVDVADFKLLHGEYLRNIINVVLRTSFLQVYYHSYLRVRQQL